jgi:hypothetical protein
MFLCLNVCESESLNRRMIKIGRKGTENDHNRETRLEMR